MKIAAYLISIGQLLCLAFLYGWCFLNKISLDWLLTLTTHPSTSKLSDNPAGVARFNSRQKSFVHAVCDYKTEHVTQFIAALFDNTQTLKLKIQLIIDSIFRYCQS